METLEKAKLARNAYYRIALLDVKNRNRAIEMIAQRLSASQDKVLLANAKDLEQARIDGLSGVLLKRLVLNSVKIDEMISSLKGVVSLPDPLGVVLLERELDDDLLLQRITVPIGVIGIIFESRPDALMQISSLCIKSGNAAILKGGKEALHTNRALFAVIEEALAATDAAFDGCLQLAETREDIKALLALDEYVDLMIPRGSNELVKYIQENTKIPVMGHADGICHVYVHEDADANMAVGVVHDSKLQYPAVCNAAETLLIHRNAASRLLPVIAADLSSVALRGCERTAAIIDVSPASETDWRTEYNDLVLSIRVVDSLESAMAHINQFGSHHTDSIVTASSEVAQQFMAGVDSSSVMWNCSTRFADGFRYGFGAEVGISTQRIHARGPVGLEGLVTYKYRVFGNGNMVADYAAGKRSFTHKTRVKG